jgi:hypothetical protein
MNLHPDERPPDVESFQQALIGSRDLPIPSVRKNTTARSLRLRQILASPVEQILLWTFVILTLFNLIITMTR